MEKNIGRFEIRGELGRGAQSVVYLAWDPQLQREVAIKTLHFSSADAARNALLLDEARMVGKFRHPHVVPIYDVGEQDGEPYLVFERVLGRSLAVALKNDGPLPAIRAATLMLQIADVLAEAHSLGIIHRDLKPSNILLDARDGAPRVMDFGIASEVSAQGKTAGEALKGTPQYLAPEYITQQRTTPQVDVFAAGLILLEMLTGKRVFDGGSIEAILYRIACEPVSLPREPAIDPRLGGIILRACALDPSQRYASADELRDALNDFLGDGSLDRTTGPTAIAQRDTLEFLLRRMRHKSDFPALSESVSAINKLTAAEGESVSALSNAILKDYALTNKILRLVNSAYYRQAGGGNISTVSRAVIVLGFDTIRNITLTVLLFEHLQDKANVRELKDAFLRANLAGLVAKDICKSPMLGRQGEEAYICAMFHGLGQLLAQYYFPEEVEEVNKLVQFRKRSVRTAATEILGITFEDLGIGIAGNWGFPPTIIDSMRPLSADEPRKPNTIREALHVAAVFGNELCALVGVTPPEQRDMALRKISQRFGTSLQISDRQVQETVEKSVVELAQLAAVLRVNVRQSSFARQVAAFASGAAGADECLSPATVPDQLADTLLGDSALLDGLEDTATAGMPDDAQAVLTAGIQDISNSLVDDFPLNDILRIILETIYRAMGFKRVLLALRDAKTGRMAGRFGLGPDVNDLVRQFRFPLGSQLNDVFLLATGRGVDIIIKDIDDPKIADKVPQWFRERVPAKTFVLFPLNIKGKSVALIYCDKDKAGSINIPEKELALLKTLRNQALLAIKQAA
ncbi:MAG: HDOD domain-containing protein [Rhodocyclaceae bacterium]|nr:HDOD domain-containing protein [Rhodocyclaceae bacterium]